MSGKEFVVECQENLQRLITAVGGKTAENRELEQLLQDLLQICDDDDWHGLEIINKAFSFADDNKFIYAAFCYRVFLQDHKFTDLKNLNTYLKCVFLAENNKKLGFIYNIISKPIEQLIEYQFIKEGVFQKTLTDDCASNKYERHTLAHKINFGDYAECSVRELLEKRPSYLLWCVIHLSHFALDNRIMVDKRLLQHDLYPQAVGFNLIKNSYIGTWKSELEDEVHYEMENYNYNWEQETFDALTDGQLGDWDDFGGDIDDARTSMGRD